MYMTFFFMITLLLYGTYLLRVEKKEFVEKRLSFLVDKKSEIEAEQHSLELQPNLFQRFVKPILYEFKRSFKRRMPGEKEAKLERKLMQAGNPFGMTPVDYRLLQIVLFILFPLALGGYASLLKAEWAGIFLFSLLGIVSALFLPHFYLKKKMNTRNTKALKELPDILDLLTVSLEAGLGFDSAMSKVVSKKEGVIASEFHRCLEEIRLGKTRREAMVGIRDRLEVDEVKSFISSILQAEKLGIGMVQVLRVQSIEVREQRKQRAEEEAMKAPIKMLFPLVLFIFPSLFIVLLGPAVIQFLDTFQNTP